MQRSNDQNLKLNFKLFNIILDYEYSYEITVLLRHVLFVEHYFGVINKNALILSCHILNDANILLLEVKKKKKLKTVNKRRYIV